MVEDQFVYLLMIGLSLLVGFAIGAIIIVISTRKEVKELENEVDKFRDLYFEELDKWRNKYVDDDDYEAY
tara:strand:- start:402 stop:611 length:210 start_codon:yes stop_codon:yes gene_type:complete